MVKNSDGILIIEEELNKLAETTKNVRENINKIHEKDCLWTTKIKAQENEEKKRLR